MKELKNKLIQYNRENNNNNWEWGVGVVDNGGQMHNRVGYKFYINKN